jgi:hypothetical protein
MEQKPTFSVYTGKHGGTSETLKHCHMGRMNLKRSNLPAIIVGKDGIVYTTMYDCKIPEGEEFEAIISFQSHAYGNFAIVRVATK